MVKDRWTGDGQYVVSQHEGSGLDDELMGLLVSDDGSREAGSAAGFTAGVDGSRRKVLHVPEETDPKQRAGLPPTAPNAIRPAVVN